LALNLAVVGEVIGLILRGTVHHAFGVVWYISALVLAGTVFVLVRNWKIYSRPRERDRSLKFLPAAYVWLFLSLGMVALLPVYQLGFLPWLGPDSAAAQMGFSHAYYGAIRYAITVEARNAVGGKRVGGQNKPRRGWRSRRRTASGGGMRHNPRHGKEGWQTWPRRP
jgi:hypothetical protein